MDFGDAIREMKAGKCVQRAGWNGKNMHIYLDEGGKYSVHGGAHNREYMPMICMYTAQGTHQPGWLASQPDMLAEDWSVVQPSG